MEASAVILLLFAIIQEHIEVQTFVEPAHLHIVAAYFFVEYLIDSFGSYFLAFNFAIEVGMDSFEDVDNIEEVVLV